MPMHPTTPTPTQGLEREGGAQDALRGGGHQAAQRGVGHRAARGGHVIRYRSVCVWGGGIEGVGGGCVEIGGIKAKGCVCVLWPLSAPSTKPVQGILGGLWDDARIEE